MTKPAPASPSRFAAERPLEAQLAVPLVVLVAEHGEVADQDHAGGVERHQRERVPPVDRGVRVGHPEHERDPAPRVGGTGDPPACVR